MFKDQKILVAGGTGFIGSNLILRLLAEGSSIRSTLHRRPAIVTDDRVEYTKADLTRMEDCVRAVEGVDMVFMCAANTSGAGVIARTPLVHLTPNVVMNAQMLDAAYAARVKKFVFISSSVVYPPSGERPVKEEEAFLGDPYETYYVAGWMKRYTEIMCKTYAEKIKEPMTTVVIRPSNIYGPYDDYDFRTSHMAAALIRRVAERQAPIEVWGTGGDVRDLIYIDDFLEGMLLAVRKTDRHNVINIAGGRGYSVQQVLETLLEVDGYRGADVRFDPSKPAMIPILLVSAARAERELGFRAKIGLREGVRRTLAWYRAARGVPTAVESARTG
ncbi:MAG: NAD-dependent epimerase/dehydratase family protein [Candidatus Omnitrophica bacterium]|nr:NAD-dependent epimerase/dehydratase family protein [Candidatus Omnitrophota bacterium]